MMMTNFKPTASQRLQIAAALSEVYALARSEWEVAQQVKAERRGYGNPSDSVPEIAAKGMIIKWFLYGVNNPDALLRDTYDRRPACTWAEGFGARCKHEGRISDVSLIVLAAGVAAYEQASADMNTRNLETRPEK